MASKPVAYRAIGSSTYVPKGPHRTELLFSAQGHAAQTKMEMKKIEQEWAMNLQGFKEYLQNEKGMSRATLSAYLSDVNEFCAFLGSKRGKEPEDAGSADVVAFLMSLKSDGRSPATVNRKLASVRAMYAFFMGNGVVSQNPTANIKSPRLPQKELVYLTIEEVETLLSLPDDTERGMRDKALLELMYATGLRVSEVAAADLEDMDLRIGFISCSGKQGKARIIPVGRPARQALTTYVMRSRPYLLHGNEDVPALFLNYKGQRITRQGVWKVLQHYAEKAGFEKGLSPHILRNSFAAHMIQNGADIKSLQELLGYEDISYAKLFLTLKTNRIMDVYDKTHPRA